LQGVKWDLVEAVKESEVVINQLTSERNDQTVWDSKACTTTGNGTRKVHKESARLVQRFSYKERNFQREPFNYLLTV
jgi:hypothetical protein